MNAWQTGVFGLKPIPRASTAFEIEASLNLHRDRVAGNRAAAETGPEAMVGVADWLFALAKSIHVVIDNELLEWIGTLYNSIGYPP